MFKDLVIKNRSYRRFYEDVRIEKETLVELIDISRNVPSTINSQSLKFILVTDDSVKNEVFETLHWAGRLKDWKGPDKGERPAAYIIIVCETDLACNKLYDEGIAAQTILLAATEKGYGGCMLGSFNKKRIEEIFHLDIEKYSADLVIALGKPKEEVRIVPVPENGDIAYYRDDNMIHYVPKRTVDELILDL